MTVADGGSNRCSWLAVMVAAVAVLAGCNDQMKSPGAARLDPLPPEQYPQVAVLEGLQPGLGFQQPVVEPSTPERPMAVTVPVRTLLDYPINIQYRFEFYDHLRRPLRSNQEGWRFLHMEPRAQTHLRGNALETEAVDWRLQIRPAR